MGPGVAIGQRPSCLREHRDASQLAETGDGGIVG